MSGKCCHCGCSLIRLPEDGIPDTPTRCHYCEIDSLRSRVAALEEALRPFTEDDEHGIHRIEGWEWRQRHPRWKEDARRLLGMEVEP